VTEGKLAMKLEFKKYPVPFKATSVRFAVEGRLGERLLASVELVACVDT
jgi:hypothetical protein